MFFKDFLLLFYYSCHKFSPLPSSIHPTSHSHSQVPHHCLCVCIIHTCSLSSFFPFFPPISLSLFTSGHYQSVSCFHACGSVLFISLFCHQIPLIGEIIWYLSFTIWFTSLSMILSRSIHAIAKGRSSFFLSLHSTPFCKCSFFFLIHSSTDEHLGYFQHLAIVNSVAMNIGVRKFF